jgi:SAM-dependent methyltransferase
MTEILTPETALAAMPLVSPTWLGVREAVDAAARSADLVARLRRRFRTGPLEIHDLGCGTGSMARWLAPLLPGPQHWVLYDRDPIVLGHVPAGGTVETRLRDISRLTADDLAGADLVTAGALLDLLTAAEVDAIAAACAGAGRPALLTMSVTGRVELDPAEPFDNRVEAAFNAHQRRVVAGRRLLGPDAVEAAVGAFVRQGVPTLLRPSPWRLGPADPELLTDWFGGWLDAACEQEPRLSGPAQAYARRRLAQIADGRLRAVVEHVDLLAGLP